MGVRVMVLAGILGAGSGDGDSGVERHGVTGMDVEVCVEVDVE